jgi:type II secretory pathway pseudopilin PulG
LERHPHLAVGARAVVRNVLVIVIVAIVAARLSAAFVRGIVKALMDREASEGTAQELSAVSSRNAWRRSTRSAPTSSGRSS